MNVEIQSSSSTPNSLTYRFGEFKMEISLSNGYLQREIVRMWKRSRSLHQYYNNLANLQGWYSIDRGTHTSLLD